METNNGIEAQNKILKYKFLPRKSQSLSSVATIIVEQFLPEQHRKYLFLNFQMDPTYRAYNSHVPNYLQGHPKKVILHCLGREEKARRQLSEKDLLEADEENGVFLVRGTLGTNYKVDFGSLSHKPSCTCHDWITNNLPCKHFFLVFTLKCNWGWNSLPIEYLNGAYLTCDTSALEEYQMQLVPSGDSEISPYHEFTQEIPEKVLYVLAKLCNRLLYELVLIIRLLFG